MCKKEWQVGDRSLSKLIGHGKRVISIREAKIRKKKIRRLPDKK